MFYKVKVCCKILKAKLAMTNIYLGLDIVTKIRKLSLEENKFNASNMQIMYSVRYHSDYEKYRYIIVFIMSFTY